MSVLLLVRHGQASFAAADYDNLSALGEEQSRLVGRSLRERGVRPALVVRGSMRRHRQTAQAAVDGAGWAGEVVEDADWDEFDHLSTVQGVAPPFSRAVVDGEPVEARARRFEQSVSRWASGEHDTDYHEDFPAFRARVEAALRHTLDRLDELGSGQTAVVFTSGGPVSWVTALLTDGGLPAWRRLADVVVNSSVSKVVTGRRGATLVSFNDHSHLEATPDLLTYR